MEPLALTMLIVSTSVVNSVCRCACMVVAATMKSHLEATRRKTVLTVLEKLPPDRRTLLSVSADSASVSLCTSPIDHPAMLTGANEEPLREL